MQPIVFSSVDDFLSLENKDLGVSQWIEITPEMRDLFNQSTLYKQVCTKEENQDGIKHPLVNPCFLLSLIPHLLQDILEVKNLKQLINYAVKSVRFKQNVPVNSKVRLIARLGKIKDLGDICQSEIKCLIELEGQDCIALDASIVYLYYFNL